ncbi:MAG TPA: GTP cyclohydrolase FolE2 [Armatimonadota bacterium]|nr:GTP cyclohydrolase FolE2 [Armatimonadota bacterium]
MVDVAARYDERGIAIQQVGVTGVYMPVCIRRKSGGYDTVVARISLAVDLQHESRGTHMSRFLAILNKWQERPISYDEVGAILADARERLQADVSHVELGFKYFIPKQAPVSGIKSLMDYDVSFRGRLDGENYRFILTANVPVTALCPCSKEISDYGAHNQRAVIKCSVELQPGKMLWIEDLVDLLEQQGSSRLFPLLKREDEKFVTEYAYEHPKFVEDILRDAVAALRQDPRVHGFTVRVDSLESIHNHNVYAAQNEGLRTW